MEILQRAAQADCSGKLPDALRSMHACAVFSLLAHSHQTR